MIRNDFVLTVVLFLLAFFIATPNISSQIVREKKPPSIRIIEIKNHARNKIEFYDSTNNRLIKSIDVVSHNPFGRFKLPVIETRDYYSTPVYELDTTKANFFIDSVELVSINNHFNSKNLVPYKLLSSYFISTQGKNYVAVMYELTTINSTGFNISSHSTILIFNSSGALVAQSPIWGINGDRPVISDDGKFILFKSGGPYGWEQEGYCSEVLIAYDLVKKEIYIDKDVDLGQTTDLIEGKYFNTSKFNSDRSTDVILYDFYNKIKYKINLKFDETYKLQGINNQGLMFPDTSGRSILKYTFEKDFVKSEINFTK